MHYKIKPWAHQVEAIKNAAFTPYYGLFFEMGTGKTGTLINILRFKISELGPQRILIFCPPIVIKNWRDEWAMHSDIPPANIITLQGAGGKRLDTFLKYSSTAHIFITNYESLLMKPLFDAFTLWRPQALVFDESHKLKSHDAKRSKLADQLANPWDKVNKRPLYKPLTYLLSGSPILNSPMDIFQQYKIMDGGQSFGHNFWAFRARYFIDKNEGMKNTNHYFPDFRLRTEKANGFEAADELNERIFSKAMRVEKKDCLDLPEEVSTLVKVGMTAEQKRLYSEMKNDFLTFYNSSACVATLAITKALRLMQITSGFVATEAQDANGSPSVPEDGPHTPATKIHQLLSTPKDEALKELLSEITEQGHKCLLWAVWRANYETLREVCKTLGLGFVEVHGGVSSREKELAIERFKTDPEIKVFLGHPGSGGIGINLVNAKYSIFYSRTFSLEHYLQARARNHRGGAEIHDKITHYDLVCEDTIDELCVSKLASKQDMSDKLLADLNNEIQRQKY